MLCGGGKGILKDTTGRAFSAQFTVFERELLMLDFARMCNRDAWLRHPVLGDASFDAFEKLGETVHRSEPPFEWAVNGSIYRDFDGVWYCYAGLYPFGYAAKSEDTLSDFIIYRSRDQGQSWELLGPGFARGFAFEGHVSPSDCHPDVVLCYDERRKKYLLTYDWATNNSIGADAFHTCGTVVDSGAALAWADSPAGPFERIPVPFISNNEQAGRLGRFRRLYATTVLPRAQDYLALSLCDSADHFAWALACMTAPSPEGPWSAPRVLLSVDRPEYYPAPVEFFPAHVVDGVVYAPATSVAKNRNYQALFTAPLEEAHDPSAWRLEQDGGVWHAHGGADERYGIWGQTYHGFFEPDTRRFVALYPSKDEREFGTLSLASRDWDTPFSDGFTLSAHAGPTVSPLLAAYCDFTLDAAFSLEGTADFAFDYHGVLGPNASVSDSVPHTRALAGYAALRVGEGRYAVVTVAEDGSETVLQAGETGEPVSSLRMEVRGGVLHAAFGGIDVCQAVGGGERPARPLALLLKPYSRLICTRFAVEGAPERYSYTYNAHDALLGAGQRLPKPEAVPCDAALTRDAWHALGDDAFVGEGRVAGKWNVLGDAVTLIAPRHPAFGVLGLWVDGVFVRAVELTADAPAPSAPVCTIDGLACGRHAVRVEALEGRIALDRLAVEGGPRPACRV